MTDDLTTLFPAPAMVTIGGREIEIMPLTMGQIAKIIKLLKGISFIEYIFPVNKPDPANKVIDWFELLAEKGDDLIEVVAIASHQKKENLCQWYVDDFIKIAVKVIEVNADFFTRRAIPAVSQAMVGLASVSSSSATATDPAISPDTPSRSSTAI